MASPRLRPPSPRPRRLRSPLPATGGAHGLASQLFGGDPEHVLLLLRAAWPAAVGHELSRRTEVVSLQGRTLRVRVPDAGWRKILHRMRRDILSRLFRTVGDLAPATLGFLEGPIAAPAVEAEAPATEPAAELPSAVREAAAAIADDELRAQFAASAARYLRRHPCGKP